MIDKDKVFHVVTNEDANQFPSIDKYKSGLEELRTMKFAGKSQDHIGKMFYDKAVLFQHMFIRVKPEHINIFDFYRVRLNLSPYENITYVRTFSYPHPFFCKNNGRANLKGKSVFYCSDSAPCSIFETKPGVGNIGYLGIWSIHAERETKLSMYLPENLRDENEWQIIAKDYHKWAKKNNQEYGNSKGEHLDILNQFICEQFVLENSNEYPITSWMANEMLYGRFQSEVILYPSIGSDTRWCNFAFLPSIVDRIMRLKKVIRFRVDSIDHGKEVGVSLGAVGDVIGTRIHWRKGTKEDHAFDEKFM